MNEARLRPRSLLPEDPNPALPREIESEVLELLVQLLLSAVPAIASEEGKGDEQNQQ